MSAEHDAAVSFRYELVRVIRESLGLPESIAVPMADHLANGMSRKCGGTYIPVSAIVREKRNEAILRDFTGANHAEVMRRHGVSRTTLYRILSEYSQKKREAGQRRP